MEIAPDVVPGVFHQATRLRFPMLPVMFGLSPNITGEIDGPGFPEKFSNIPFSGAISASRNGSYSGRGGGNVNLIVEFSAEKSNSIYGKNTTVQPPALQSLACIKT